nr:LemA family protein [Spirochaeta sp.]
MHHSQSKIIILIMTVLLFSGCGYNTIQRNEEAVFKAWGDLESQLQRRADLIPNLVAVVKGYAAHEKETLEAVIEARAKATSVQLSAESLSNPEAVANFQA